MTVAGARWWSACPTDGGSGPYGARAVRARQVKEGWLDGARLNAHPEFDDCKCVLTPMWRKRSLACLPALRVLVECVRDVCLCDRCIR